MKYRDLQRSLAEAEKTIAGITATNDELNEHIKATTDEMKSLRKMKVSYDDFKAKEPRIRHYLHAFTLLAK